MSFHELFATFVAVTAIASYINDRWIKLPKTIALTIISIVIAFAVSLVSKLQPDFVGPVYQMVKSVDFKTTVLDVMLGYLLFASGLHVNSIELRKEITPVIYLASFGVVISTFLTGYMLYYVAQWLHVPLTIGECLIFGALISPTDAIAVLGTFKSIKNPPQRLRVLITGEGLFNDAGAILMLVILSQVVYENVHLTVGHVVESLMMETGGGIIMGMVVGFVASYLIKRAKSPEVATMVTIAASSCGYVLANRIHVSGVITMVVAGLLIGGYAKKDHFRASTKIVINNFWELIDEILNAFLFVLIGLTMINIKISNADIMIGAITIIIVFVARFLSIWAPDWLMGKIFNYRTFSDSKKTTLLAWGGIRGGLSIALALSIDGLSDSLVAVTYVVVLSSILIQGGTFKWAISKFAK
ncbi:MAG: sodium:proton antiporter [Proteobacteria bacterium]|nr:MAG: sodium:proton antiporter [Pseudomonadota bacterium]